MRDGLTAELDPKAPKRFIAESTSLQERREDLSFLEDCFGADAEVICIIFVSAGLFFKFQRVEREIRVNNEKGEYICIGESNEGGLFRGYDVVINQINKYLRDMAQIISCAGSNSPEIRSPSGGGASDDIRAGI